MLLVFNIDFSAGLNELYIMLFSDGERDGDGKTQRSPFRRAVTAVALFC